ncbi:MAG: 50S ribosomal protein L24 [Chloroflexi bacterium]|nr:50S ribosomal protein L24 [Chloroflexota bacterium]
MSKIRKNDEVMVLVGRDQGKKGKVLTSIPDRNRVLVEGVNMIKRHMKPSRAVRQAGIIEREASIHVSDVKLICKKCSKPTRVGFRFLEDGRKVRVCKKCHEVID